MSFQILKKALPPLLVRYQQHQQRLRTLSPLLPNLAQVLRVVLKVAIGYENRKVCISGVGTEFSYLVNLLVPRIQPLPFDVYDIAPCVVFDNSISSIARFKVREVSE